MSRPGVRGLGWLVAVVPLVAVVGIAIAALAAAPAPAAAPGPIRPAASTGRVVDASPTPTPSPDGTPGPQADPAWLTATAASTGIPRRALQAYASAALRLAASDPACHLTWSTLAAIGDVESDHGTLDGTPVNAAGEPAGFIIGPKLDGIRYDLVPDTDGGAIDHLTTGDRAVGPMQLLPAMWVAYGADGSGDGVADPNQIDDAALGAANMLCATGDDLGTPDGWQRAITGYNPATDYVTRVQRIAAGYAADAPKTAG